MRTCLSDEELNILLRVNYNRVREEVRNIIDLEIARIEAKEKEDKEREEAEQKKKEEAKDMKQ